MKRSIGLEPLPEGTVDWDFKAAGLYQSFSAELVRLSLLGIAAIGFFLVQLDPGSDARPSVVRQNLSEIAPWLYGAVVCFGLGSAFALAHRYLSGDGLACHLRYLRLNQRLVSDRSTDETERAASEEALGQERSGARRMWRLATAALGVATTALAAGAGMLAVALWWAISLLADSGAASAAGG